MKTSLAPVVKGKVVDDFTRCVHYHSALDVIAIRFRCCNEYYPCYECHEEVAGHPAELWRKSEFDTKAILCGICKKEMTINKYLASDSRCPNCNSPFNPNCSKHFHLYFEI